MNDQNKKISNQIRSLIIELAKNHGIENLVVDINDDKHEKPTATIKYNGREFEVTFTTDELSKIRSNQTSPDTLNKLNRLINSISDTGHPGPGKKLP